MNDDEGSEELAPRSPQWPWIVSNVVTTLVLVLASGSVNPGNACSWTGLVLGILAAAAFAFGVLLFVASRFMGQGNAASVVTGLAIGVMTGSFTGGSLGAFLIAVLADPVPLGCSG